MEDLVIPALEKAGVDDRIGRLPPGGEPGAEGQRVPLGDADIEQALRIRFTKGGEPGGHARRGCDGADRRVLSRQRKELLTENGVEGLGGRRPRAHAMVLIRVRLRARITFTFLGVQVHDHAFLFRLGFLQRALDALIVIPVIGTEVGETHILKIIMAVEEPPHEVADAAHHIVKRLTD